MAFTNLKVKSAKCLCLLPVVLVSVLRIWSCIHHWQRIVKAMKSYAQQPQLFAANGRCIYQAIQRSRVGHLPEVVDASCCTGREVVFNLLQTGNMLSTINNLARCLSVSTPRISGLRACCSTSYTVLAATNAIT